MIMTNNECVLVDELTTNIYKRGYDQGYKDGQKDRDMDIPPSIDDAYNRGYKDAEMKHFADLDYKEGLEDGRMEAWECARKLCQSEKYGGLEEHCAEIFDRQDTFDVFDYSASEAIAKMKEWENSWHIKMPFENIHGELYCKYSDVQKLYEQMKGESE